MKAGGSGAGVGGSPGKQGMLPLLIRARRVGSRGREEEGREDGREQGG